MLRHAICALLLVLGEVRAEEMPECMLQDLSADTQLMLRQLHPGSVRYVEFWASWCAACKQSIGFLNGLERDFQHLGLTIIGISLDENPADAREFLGRHPAQFTVLTDPGADCARRFSVQGLPAAYLIDRSGVIRQQQRGLRSGGAITLRQQVERLVAEPQ